MFDAAKTGSPAADAALRELCVAYWYPLYAFLRRSGHAPDAAEDLTQEFFASRMVTKRIFQGVQPGKGRFRSWLLTSLQNMVWNERDKARTAKRGGAQPHTALDFESAEDRYGVEPAHNLTPEKLYERSCAVQLLDLTFNRLKEKYRRAGKADQFEELKAFLPGEHSADSHAAVAARLGRSAGAIKEAVSRLRGEYRRILKAEVTRIVDGPDAVEDELRCLLAALRD